MRARLTERICPAWPSWPLAGAWRSRLCRGKPQPVARQIQGQGCLVSERRETCGGDWCARPGERQRGGADGDVGLSGFPNPREIVPMFRAIRSGAHVGQSRQMGTSDGAFSSRVARSCWRELHSKRRSPTMGRISDRDNSKPYGESWGSLDPSPSHAIWDESLRWPSTEVQLLTVGSLRMRLEGVSLMPRLPNG